MLLSDLIKFRDELRNELNSVDLVSATNLLCENLKTIVNSTPNVRELVNNTITNNVVEFTKLVDHSHRIVANLKTYTDELTNLIDSKADDQFKNSENLNPFLNGSEIKYRITLENAHVIKTRIAQYTSWNYPALQFGCRYNGEYLVPIKGTTLGVRLSQGDPNTLLDITKNLVSADPLYIVDFNKEYIDSAVSQFNHRYQNKICRYVINGADFSKLPQGQFGFIVSWNMFNYSNISTLTLFLTKLFDLLRPGGVVFFNYNNCDLLDSMKMAETGRATYLTLRKLKSLVTELGYEVINHYDLVNDLHGVLPHVSWIEIKRPGNLTSSKASPTIGQIVKTK